MRSRIRESLTNALVADWAKRILERLEAEIHYNKLIAKGAKLEAFLNHPYLFISYGGQKSEQ